MFVKGAHERQFAYEAHTACDKNGYVFCVEVTAGNVHDSVAWDALYAQVTARFSTSEYFTMDAAYTTPRIMKKILDDNSIPIVPYTRYKGKKDVYKPWARAGQLYLSAGLRAAAHDHEQGRKAHLPQHAEGMPELSLPGGLWRQRERPACPDYPHLAGAGQLRNSERGQEIYALQTHLGREGSSSNPLAMPLLLRSLTRILGISSLFPEYGQRRYSCPYRGATPCYGKLSIIGFIAIQIK